MRIVGAVVYWELRLRCEGKVLQCSNELGQRTLSSGGHNARLGITISAFLYRFGCLSEVMTYRVCPIPST